MPLFHSAWRRHLLALGLYSLLAVLLTWPLILHLTTHVPGVPQWAFDESTFVWNIWQFKHALIDNLQSPLHSELIWFPLGIDLILYTYNFYHVLAAMPLALAVNLPFASNITLLASTVLSGYGTWLLVSYLLKRVETGDWRLGQPDASRPQSPNSNHQSPVITLRPAAPELVVHLLNSRHGDVQFFPTAHRRRLVSNFHTQLSQKMEKIQFCSIVTAIGIQA